MKDNNYYVVHGWMRNRLGLKGNNLLIFAIMFGFSQDGESRFSGSLSYIEECTGATRPTINKCIKDLIKQGYIEKHKKIVNGVHLVDYSVVKEIYRVVKKLTRGSKETYHHNIIDNIASADLTKKGEITPSMFDEFWKKWPSSRRGNSKEKARTIWNRICARKKNRPTWVEIRTALKEHRQSEQWQDEEFIPLITTWLNQNRWLDDASQLKKPTRFRRRDNVQEQEEYIEPRDKSWMK